MTTKKQSVKNLSVYFPDHSYQQLLLIAQSNKLENNPTKQTLQADWGNEFCSELGLTTKNIPWNKLRALQFDIDPNTPTIVCCDPVMMQMTHRGAYLWGQQSLDFTKEETIRIVAQINQQLMGDDECFYLVDNYQWLYVNKKPIELQQPSFEQLIGKDLFGFSYNGNDHMFWSRLATEIQMLIKQMMDYQGLTQAPAEMMVNVHFWGDTKVKLSAPFEKVVGQDLQVFLSDNLLESLIKESGVELSELSDFSQLTSENGILPQRNNILLVKENNHLELAQFINDIITYSTFESTDSVRFITQDQVIVLAKSQSFLSSFLSVFKRRKPL